MEHFGREQEQEKDEGGEEEAEREEEAGGGGESTALFEVEATQPSNDGSDSSSGGSRWGTRIIRPREGSGGARYGGGKDLTNCKN